MRRLATALAALVFAVPALLAGAPAARAYVPEETPDRTLQHDAARVLAAPAARGGVASIVVMRGGVAVYSRNANRSMQPASLTKLATTTAAMVRFGPDHRFSTRVLAPRGSAVATPQRMYLVGGGDPTFATEAYRRFRFLPKPTDRIKAPAFTGGSPTVEQLANAVRRAGVRAVSGDLVCDESLFDSRRTQPGWLSRYLTNDPDTGLLSALVANEGRADLKGKVLVPQPAVAAGNQLKAALAARGVRVGGRVVIGRAPADATQVAAVRSPPLSQIVNFTNRYSINFDAELLLKSLGASFGGAGSTRAGVKVVFDTLGSLGVPLEGARLYDGSGLSVLNRLEPRTIAAILDRILRGDGPGWQALRDSLPVAGGPGTLEKRMRRAPTGGNLRGKTGLIAHVRNMAGWVTAADGVPVVYTMMFNGVPSPLALNGPLDLFGLLLALFPSA
jgi:D-alanyl-D-alanine carboxypeptidase/D-alanyl-D-alanine-endopeptidase (penicillin-binding protein 4)